MKSICIYCGSSDKIRSVYLDSARQIGTAIAQRGLTMVYGAGSTGMMGAVANGALQAGGEVVGVIPEVFATSKLMHNSLTRLEIVKDMHTRKARMIELADAFIALPGGFGTFEELFEILTWAQIGLHRKPTGLLNTNDYFIPLLKMVEHAKSEGFIYAEHTSLISHTSDPDELLDSLGNYTYPGGLERWLTREE